jgi:antitoxin VapB
MSTTKTAKLFRNGRSQAVRLPREFRFEGNEVRVRQIGDAVLLEPIISDTHKWFEELDRFKSEPFMTKGSRNQARTPRRKIFE